jgi:glycosyltransferase involved in cell wall biosynthesis
VRPVETPAPVTSVVVPVYANPESLAELHERVAAVFGRLGRTFELILVNDGCPSGSWPVIEQLAAGDPRIVGINLSRNFGQQRAILAGLDHARGDTVVVIDCDLQDPPEGIEQLFQRYEQGYDSVIALRENRKDSYFKKVGSRLFTRVFNYMTDSDLGEDEINFSLFSRRVLLSLRALRDQNVFHLLNLHWVGFRVGYIKIEHARRKHGRSSYSFKALMKLAGSSILAHSNKPLKLMIAVGFTVALLAALFTSGLLIRYFFFDIPAAGWTSVMVSLYFLFGVLFANLGVIGLYIGGCFDETKRRPLYLVMQTINHPGTGIEGPGHLLKDGHEVVEN